MTPEKKNQAGVFFPGFYIGGIVGDSHETLWIEIYSCLVFLFCTP